MPCQCEVDGSFSVPYGSYSLTLIAIECGYDGEDDADWEDDEGRTLTQAVEDYNACDEGCPAYIEAIEREDCLIEEEE